VALDQVRQNLFLGLGAGVTGNRTEASGSRSGLKTEEISSFFFFDFETEPKLSAQKCLEVFFKNGGSSVFCQEPRNDC